MAQHAPSGRPCISDVACSLRVAAGDVTCHMTVDNKVNAVYYDGVDITSSVQGDRGDWTKRKSVTFPAGPGLLAIQAEECV